MPGFNLSLGKKCTPFSYKNIDRYICDRIEGNKYVANRFTIKKFKDDKIFINRDDYLVILEGVILNKRNLIKEGHGWEKTVVDLYGKNGEDFFKYFKGSFSGALHDKKEDKWIIFNDHIGSKHLYFSIRDNSLYLSSEIADLYTLFKNNGLSYSLDQQGAYMLLSYGYMLDDYTLCTEIKKLLPGHYITYRKGEVSIKQYYSLPSEYNQAISEEEAIEKVDELFRKAIELQFEKDREYGYKHLVALSGGMDSRMTSWVAHKMGYTDQLNLTFSQSGYLDETIAKEIAADLKHEWIFKALDNGLFLKDIDEINRISGGGALYYGLAHGNSVLKLLNFKGLGILHSGQLGDVVIAAFINKEKNTYDVNTMGAYSYILTKKVRIKNKNFKLKKAENFLMNQRGFNGANTGLLPSQNYSETFSPFYDIDLLTYCLQIPNNIRTHHNLYRKWIIKKYPHAADYIWESTRTKITKDHWGIPYKGRKIPFKQLPAKILNKMGIKRAGTHSKYHMNPLDYWYETNPELKGFQDTYFKQNIDRLEHQPDLQTDCESLYHSGTAIEKSQVLTLLSAIKLFF